MAINLGYNIKQITNEDINDSDDKRYGIAYKTILENAEVLKMGYCCEQKGTMYPIFIKTNDGDYQEIQLNSNGMYEMETTPENWKINGVQVPIGIKFTLDYVVNKNEKH